MTFYPAANARISGSIAFLLLLSGCGYVGEPLPPLLNIPARADDLAAIQRGSQIIAHFTVPAMTTEGIVRKQAVHLELRIGPKPAGPFNGILWAPTAKLVAGGTVENNLAQYSIPAAEWVGKEVAIAAKIAGANGRDAGWSNPVILTVVAPPEQPRDLRAEAVAQGVHLTWRAAGNTFAVFRRGPEEKTFAALSRPDKPEWTDTTAEFGKTYRYIVQSVTKAGEGEAQSDLSDEVEITPIDTFPPAAPAGLTAVPSTATIELVWERNTEPTVVGYRVYRAVGSAAMERLADTQELPSYSDRKVESGKVYRYAVTAVKGNGLESPKSPPVGTSAP